MMTADKLSQDHEVTEAQRRKSRRFAIGLGVIAVGVYALFVGLRLLGF